MENCCRSGNAQRELNEKLANVKAMPEDQREGWGSSTGYTTSVAAPKLIAARKKSILEEAEEIINGERAKAYGHPTPNHRAIASLWQAYLNNRETLGIDGDLTPEDAALMMVLLKVARLQFLPDHRDSLVDIAGYVGCVERIVEG